jgi:hypothetical protein
VSKKTRLRCPRSRPNQPTGVVELRFLFKLLLRLFLLGVVLLPLALAGLIYLAVEDQARVAARTEFGPAQVARAKQVLSAHDPRKLRDGDVRTLSVSQSELDLVAMHLLSAVGNGAAASRISHGRLELEASLRLPANPLGRYVNVSLSVREAIGLPRVRHLRIGRISVPDALSDLLLEQALDRWYAETKLSASDLIREVKLDPERVRMTYRWRSEIVQVARERLVSPEDQRRLDAYHQHLVAVVPGEGLTISLAKLVEAMFVEVTRRSAAGDPVAENRAAIVVLTSYVNGNSLEPLVPAAADWPQPARLEVTVHGRSDLPKHFMISAALAAAGSGALSQAIGVFKEVDDSRGGSGFSFVDLIADNAGTRFGARATATPAEATQLQRDAHTGLTEAHLIPDPSGLEENMTEATFKRRYGGVGEERYSRVVRDIERRIDASPLYR